MLRALLALTLRSSKSVHLAQFCLTVFGSRFEMQTECKVPKETEAETDTKWRLNKLNVKVELIQL